MPLFCKTPICVNLVHSYPIADLDTRKHAMRSRVAAKHFEVNYQQKKVRIWGLGLRYQNLDLPVVYWGYIGVI